MRLQKATSKPKSFQSFSFWILILSITGLIAYTWMIGKQINHTYDQVDQALLAASEPLAVYELPNGKTLYITSFVPFQQGEILGLISHDRPLPQGYRPDNLTSLTVPHDTSDGKMHIQKRIGKPLEKLFAEARKAGHPLMVSSAYRSIDQQKAIYQEYIAKFGQAMADEYVADPQASEHHTGLSVDLSDATDTCRQIGDCNLSEATAGWLHKNAPNYGFIQRYPKGKKPITGIAHEPWHYRYVGVVMAHHIHESDITFDEVIKQIQPGLFK